MNHRLALLALPALALSALPAQAASPFNADVALVIAGNWTQETVPRDASTPFPLDASPVIRIGDGPLGQMVAGVEGAVFHVPDDGSEPVRLDATIDTRTVPMPGGTVDWIRITPDELLAEGESYRLRLVAPLTDDADPEEQAREQEFVDNNLLPVDFIAGPPRDDAPIAPDATIRVLDHGARPGSPFNPPIHNHSTIVDIPVAEADFDAHDTWVFFQVEEDFAGDVADLSPHRWTTPAILTDDQVEVTSWQYPAPTDAGRRCVVAATEDAYGALAASDVQCADPVNAACDGCSSAGPSRGGLAAILGMVLAVGSRRRRFSTAARA